MMTFNSLMDAISAYEHDFEEKDGKKIHSYVCRRCHLERQGNFLRQEIQTFLGNIDRLIGTVPNEPKRSN
jgi:hypothetical protein